jgi:hypothetical protein
MSDKPLSELLRDDDDSEIEEREAELLGSLGTGTGPITVHAVLLLMQHQQRKILKGVAASSARLVTSSEQIEGLTRQLVGLTCWLKWLTIALVVLTATLIVLTLARG